MFIVLGHRPALLTGLIETRVFSHCAVGYVFEMCLEVENRIYGEGRSWNAGGEFPLNQVVEKLHQKQIDFSKLKEIITIWFC